MIHDCHCCKDIHKASKTPRRGRPLPDALLPVEIRYAKVTQNYLSHWYAAVTGAGPKSDVIDQLHLPPKISTEMYSFTESYIGDWAGKAGEAAARGVGIQVTDFIDRPRVVSAMQREAHKFLKSVDASVKQALRDTLKAGQEGGEDLDQMAARVKEALGFDREKGVYVPASLDEKTTLENWRAERIARTESAHAITVGETEGWNESGVVKAVEWVAAGDSCPFCDDMDGETTPLGTPFLVVGDSLTVIGENGKPQTMVITYRDVYGPPLHPNDRCALKAVLSDEFSNHPHEDDTTETLED